MDLSELLVCIPHSGVICPSEISLESLLNRKQLHENVDSFTDKIYDFRDILGNQQMIFSISQVYINITRNPSNIDACVPLSIKGVQVYKKQSEPSLDVRKGLVKKYFNPFHRKFARIPQNSFWGGIALLIFLLTNHPIHYIL